MSNEFDYIKLAGKTNNTNYPEIKQRIVDEDMVDAMAFLFATSQDISVSMDQLKKLMFYGKDPKEVELASDEVMEIDEEKVLSRLDSPEMIDILHGVIGIYTEAGELIEALRDYVYKGKELDIVNLSEEIGDIFWYSALIAKHAGKSFEDIQVTNIRKLMQRFPNGFSNEDAKIRDLQVEREILEE
jgi:NTP pyrophosphatase (non-canonical NTP hydrolase)